MNAYNYQNCILEDVRNYINDEYSGDVLEELEDDREALAEALEDEMWTADSVTGNASGSYTFSIWKAEENICHNLDLLRDACEEMGVDMGSLVEQGAEACDVTIRCYLLGWAISDVLDEIEDSIETEERPC